LSFYTFPILSFLSAQQLVVFPSVAEEDFNLVRTGELPADFPSNQTPSPLLYAGVEVESENNKILRIYDLDISNNITLTKNLTRQDGIITVEFDFTAYTLGNSIGFYLLNNDGGLVSEVCLFANDSNGFSAFNGGSILTPSPQVPIILEQTYHVELIVDIPQQEFNVYINGTPLQQGGHHIDFQFRNGTEDAIDTLQIMTQGTTTQHSVTIDKLSIWNENDAGHYFSIMSESNGITYYTPFFFFADTAWSLFYNLTNTETETYLENRSKKGFTVVQFALVGGEFDNTDAYGNDIWLDTSPLIPNDDYFDRVADLVDYANSLGLWVMLLPTWGDNVTVSQEINLSNAYDYSDYLGTKFAGKDVIWSLGGDQNPTGYFDVWDDLWAGLQNGGSGEQLITYHPRGGQSSASWYHTEDWLAFNMNQSGHRRYSNPATISIPNPKETLISDNWTRIPNKPILDDESGYEQIVEGLDQNDMNDRITAHDVRVAAYCTVFSGAAGYGYGSNGVFQATQTPYSGTWAPDLDWEDALERPASIHLGYLRDLLLDGRPFYSRIPDQNMIVSGLGEDYHTIWVTRDVKGSYALAYIAEGQSISLDLTPLAGFYAKAYWLNPRTGAPTAIGSVACSPSVNFTPPSSGLDNDWILVLDIPGLSWDGPSALFNDNFLDATIGQFPSGWSGSAGNGTTTVIEVIADPTDSGSVNVLSMFDAADGFSTQATHTFPAQTEPLVIEFEFYGVDDGALVNSRKAYFYIQDLGICLYAGPSNFSYHNGDGIVQLDTAFSNNHWYNFRVEVDITDNTFNLNIDDDRYEDLPFRQQINSISKISLISPSDNQGNQVLNCYWSNVRVSYWNAPFSLARESFNDTTSGSLPDGWLGSTTSGTATLGVVDDPTGTDDRQSVLRLYDATDSYTIQGIQTFPAQTDACVVEVDYYGGVEGSMINERSTYLYVGGTSVCLYLGPTSLSYHNGSSIVSLGIACANETWHHLRLEIDIQSDTFVLEFNEQRFEGLPFRNSASSIDRISLISPSNNGGNQVVLNYWDNLRVLPASW